ncbi:DUF802 domain-containing protein [Bordetella genomosp. 13]|uniref:DUF802 domain-containing protein n=1 Tax=Bordetella genomosp. 13 TaxID=463040 RepID=A0A1W6Z9E6_9BORD|nr:DUF802 domain-containing protein [Bordetella genomosp. 13]ARP93855.1 hypothetical protein CAL15_05315 [Bordetella genomosp. 13]
MTRYLAPFAIFLAGLAAVCWIAAGYVGTNPLALSVTLLIALVYVAGALELSHYRRATRTLELAASESAEPGAAASSSGLDGWLARLHPSLRNPVRLRVEGVRVGLPSPSLTPYLVGLLVLLGMLGTFLGMVATLRGTGAALESATDLQAMRASLAAPVQGLGFAFGTSVAGVAASAMLGLLAALCRRERIRASQALDARIATGLRAYSPAHQREQVLALLQRQAGAMPTMIELLQRQAEAMPTVVGLLQRQAETMPAMVDLLQRQTAAMPQMVDLLQRQTEAMPQMVGLMQRQTDAVPAMIERLQALAADMGQQNRSLQEGIAAGQENAQARADAAHERLVQAVERSLQDNTASGERLVQTMDRALQQNTAAGGQLIQAMDKALQENVAAGHQLVQTMDRALQEHAAAGARLAQSMDQALQDNTAAGGRLAQALEQSLQENVAAGQRLAATMDQTLQAHAQAGARLAQAMEQAMQDNAAAAARAAGEAIAPAVERTLAGLAREAVTLQETVGQAAQRQVEGFGMRLDGAAALMADKWNDALARHQQAGDALAGGLRAALDGFSGSFEERMASLLREVNQSHAALQSTLAEQDQQRLQAWHDKLGAIANDLRQDWETAGQRAEQQHQSLGESLAQTARELAEQTQAHARDTVAEVTRLVEAAAQAPKAAAEAIDELRRSLTLATARDNEMLEERNRLLETLDALLGNLTQAGNEQRAAVDALVARAGEMLERTSSQVAGQVETESGRLSDAAAQVTGSAIEIASLGDAFGAAVQLFGQASEQLAERLQRIETALDKSMARSDEQLAYYVAQAREVVDLSVLSQKQIIEDLQQLAAGQADAGATPQ